MPIDPNKFEEDFILSNKVSKKIRAMNIWRWSAQSVREMEPDTKPRGHVVRVNGMRYELNDKISDDTVLSYETGFGYDFRYAITSEHSRRQMIAFFEGIDIWKTNEFLAVQREFE